MTLPYHKTELRIAMDRNNPLHWDLPVKPHHKRILDVGGGMGQTLIAAQLRPGIFAVCVDPDEEAVKAGQKIAPNINFHVCGGERLPFEDGSFDLVYSRVSLPYMDVKLALSEMTRVLADGGDLILVLHSWSMTRRRWLKSLRTGSLKDVLYCGFITANGLLFSTTNFQMNILGKKETFQTVGGMSRELVKRGLEVTSIQRRPHFVIEAKRRQGQ
jgi:SAM-dependent methyltransferase